MTVQELAKRVFINQFAVDIEDSGWKGPRQPAITASTMFMLNYKQETALAEKIEKDFKVTYVDDNAEYCLMEEEEMLSLANIVVDYLESLNYFNKG